MNRFLHQAPFIRVVIPQMVGAVIGVLLPIYLIQPILYGVILLLLLIIYKFRKKWKYHRFHLQFGLLYFLVVGLCGYMLASIHLHLHHQEIQFPVGIEGGQAILIKPLREGPNSYYGEFKLISFYRDSALFSADGPKFIIYAAKDSTLLNMEPGTNLFFLGQINHLQHAINPYQFDYANYLENKGIAGSAFVGENYSIGKVTQTKFNLIEVFKGIQIRCIEILGKSEIPKRELSVLNALVLGYKLDLQSSTKSQFADAGVVHILAVSGLHVGIIYFILQWLLARILGKRVASLQFIIILIVIWFYAGITGFSPSVLRASTMFSFIAFGSVGGKRGNTYNMIAASIILLLLINPLIIREIGFQLSYLAVIGIVFFYDKIIPLFWSKFWLVQRAWELMVVSMSAQLATAALSIYYFGQFPNYFLISNLIVIPLATISLYGGLLYLIIHPIPYLGSFIAILLKYILMTLSYAVSLFSSLPGAVTQGLQFSLIEVISIYTLIILFILIVVKPNKVRIRLIWIFSLVLLGSLCFKRIRASARSQLYLLEGKNGLLVFTRNGKSASVVPLYTSQEIDGFSQNEFYLSDLIRNEGIRKVRWVEHKPFDSKHLLAYPGITCFQNVVIQNAQTGLTPKSGMIIKVFSGGFEEELNELDFYDKIVIDRSCRSWEVKKIYNSGIDKSKIWNMKTQGVFKVDYSDLSF